VHPVARVGDVDTTAHPAMLFGCLRRQVCVIISADMRIVHR
jgi:hypothetical protein